MTREPLFTLSEVAQYLRVDPATVRRWIDDGVLQAIELPHRGRRRVHRIPESTLNALAQCSPARQSLT